MAAAATEEDARALSPRGKGGALVESLALAASLFAIYAAGACRTIYVGDSGELVAAVHTLGIPHPSGYPLYVLLGKLWTVLVPFGSVAFRMSLFSAAAAAAAVAVVYGLGRRRGLGRPAALCAATLVAFGPSFWGEANVQRVYTLGALFVALALALATEWFDTRRLSLLLAAFFVCGLGASNHTFMAVFAIALGLFAVAVEPGFRRPVAWGGAGLAMVAGLLPYLFLYLRARTSARLDWGRPDTLERLLAVVTRRDFWGRAWIESPGDLVAIGLDYGRGLGLELLGIGAVLAAVGVVVGFRRRWPVALFLLVAASNLAAMAAHGSRADIFIWHRYYIPSYLIAALLAGIGAQAAIDRFGRAAAVAVLLVPALLFALGFRRFDRSGYRIADAFSRELLSELPPGAHLSATDDNILFVLIYLQFVEEVRPDVDLILQGVGGTDLPPLAFDPDTNPLYLTHHPNWHFAGLEVVPVGLSFRTQRAGKPLPPLPEMPPSLPGEDDPRVPKDYLTQNLIGQFHYMHGLTLESRDWPGAEREFARATAAAPENDVLFYNLGLIYRREGLLDESEQAFARADAINPRALATAGKVRASDRLVEVRQERRRLDALEATLSAQLPPGTVPGSAAYHEELAELLARAGENTAARAHRLRMASARS